MKHLKLYQLIKQILILIFLVCAVSCSEEHLEQEEKSVLELENKDPDVIEGHYIIIISREPAGKNSKAASDLEELSKKVGAMEGARINRKYETVLTGFAAELTDEQVKKLQKDPRVKSIVQDSYVYLFTDPVLQEFPTWGIDRTDQRDLLLDRIYGFTTMGTGVNVYVLDSGIRYSHEEFGGRATLGYDFMLEDDPDNTDPNQQPGEDCMGHGTHVAGTVGGKTYGVAKDVNLISVRVFGCAKQETPQSRVIAAIEWITNNAIYPALVNMSLGYESDSDVVTSAVQNSIQAGIHYVVAAGNSNNDACLITPARTPEALTVGATEIGDNRAYFSSYGNCVDLYAPGYRITSASHMDDSSTIVYSGTSMAAPHVAGVVANYLQEYPEATPANVHTALIENSTPHAVSEVPSGSNNLLYSLWTTFSKPSPNSKLTSTGQKVKGKQVIDLTWDAITNAQVKIYRNGQLILEEASNGSYRDNTEISGNDGTYIHHICEIAPFYQDICSNETTTIFGDGGGDSVNSSPTADFTYTEEQLNVQFTDISTDSDGSITGWNWDFGDGKTSAEQSPYYSYSDAGSYTVSLNVTDDGGATGSASKNISVSAEEPLPGEITLSGKGYKVKGLWHTDLTWTPSGTSEMVDLYQNGYLVATVANSGSYTDATSFKGGGSLIYMVCEAGTNTCSNKVTVQF